MLLGSVCSLIYLRRIMKQLQLQLTRGFKIRPIVPFIKSSLTRKVYFIQKN